ncbi:hypothetical protein [Streptomyces rimosus]|uniref:hypothetical protein n=1 Tax=Streptomyces rimosus TaxID=1927 RepID=UPI00131BCC42|nr:hypothetical protein [Streptomyces rimosus]
MGRRPKALNPNDPLHAFAIDLNALRDAAGPAGKLGATCAAAGITRSTYYAWLSGAQLPSGDLLEVVVKLWGGDVAQWTERRRKAQASVASADVSEVPHHPRPALTFEGAEKAALEADRKFMIAFQQLHVLTGRVSSATLAKSLPGFTPFRAIDVLTGPYAYIHSPDQTLRARTAVIGALHGHIDDRETRDKLVLECITLASHAAKLAPGIMGTLTSGVRARKGIPYPDIPDRYEDLRHKKIMEAERILHKLGFGLRAGEHAAYVLLGLLRLGPDQHWEQIEGPDTARIGDIAEWVRRFYRKEYAANSRETLRRQIRRFIETGLVIQNPDEPDRAVNSAATRYQIAAPAHELITTYADDGFEERLKVYLAARRPQIE